jgi:hypothetical protein
MNHTATDKEIQPERNLWAEMILNSLNDLDPETNTGICNNRRWTNWIAEYCDFHESFKNWHIATRNNVRFIPHLNALNLWAVGGLDDYAMDRFIGKPKTRISKHRRNQIRYNLTLKRWIDRVYVDGDAMLTALMIVRNPGLMEEYATRAGMNRLMAIELEARLKAKARPQLDRLFRGLVLESSRDGSEFPYRPNGNRGELFTTKEDVS